MRRSADPPEINPREDRYEAALPEHGVSFLRERTFRVIRDGPSHMHRDQVQMLFVLRGRMGLCLGQQRHQLAATQAIIIPQATRHRLAVTGTTEPLRFIDCRVTGARRGELRRAIGTLPAARPLACDDTLLMQSASEIASAASCRGWRRTTRLLAAMWRLLSCVELAPDQRGTTQPPQKINHRIRRAEAFIADRLADDIGVDDIAQAAGLSRSQLTRLYHDEMSQGPAQRLRAIRLHAARQLLAAGGMSVKEVARAVGFRWVHHFIRTYRQQRGHTPSADIGVDD